MAATWIKSLHVNKGKTIAQTITDGTDYAENPDKTRKGELISGYQCIPHTTDSEFLLSKQQYSTITGRNQGKHDVLAYYIRQVFKPGETTPEQANKLGYELATRFTRGRHAFIVARSPHLLFFVSLKRIALVNSRKILVLCYANTSKTGKTSFFSFEKSKCGSRVYRGCTYRQFIKNILYIYYYI